MCLSLCLCAVIVGVLLLTFPIRWWQDRSERWVSLLEGEGYDRDTSQKEREYTKKNINTAKPITTLTTLETSKGSLLDTRSLSPFPKESDTIGRYRTRVNSTSEKDKK